MRLHVERQTASPSSAAEPARELGGLGVGERHPLAKLDRRAAMREADEVAASSCEVRERQREPDDDDEREARQSEVGGPSPSPPRLEAE